MLEIKKIAKQLQDQIVFWRRDLHQIPEVGLNLPQTEKYILEVLDKIDCQIETRFSNSGLIAMISNSYDSKSRTIAVRTDMDGLNIKERTGLPYSSKNKSNMHACGHDAHMAIVLGAAKILSELKDNFRGKIKFIFQPGEEGPGGALPMIKEGVLDNVDAIIGFHIGIFPELKNGQIGVSYGPTMACLDKFSIKIKGKGGHGAQPEFTIDPVVISASLIQELQTLISREISPTHPGVISVGKVSGGTAYNIIPEVVNILGTARFIYSSDREKFSKRMGKLAHMIAEAKGASVNYNYKFGYPPLINEKKFTDFFVNSIKKIIKENNIIKLKNPSMAGEDMAYYLKEIPGCYFFLGGLKRKDGKQYPHHHPKFDVDESVFWLGTAVLVNVVLDWLKINFNSK